MIRERGAIVNDIRLAFEFRGRMLAFGRLGSASIPRRIEG
jgi:hypothetical protein